MKYIFAVVVAAALGWFGVTRFQRATVPANAPVAAPAVSSPPVAKIAQPAPLPKPAAPLPAPPASPPPVAPKPPVATPAQAVVWSAVPWPTTPSPVNEPGKLAAPPAPLPQIVLTDVLGPNNLYHDDTFGVSATLPEGWKVASASRWGTNNSENTVSLTLDTPTSARASMYYQMFPNGYPEIEGPEAYFRRVAQNKENQRVSSGVSDYKNVPGSFEFAQIDGNPAVSYFAVFSRGEQVQTEYFVRVLGKKGYVMFFVPGRLEDVQAIMPQIKQMAATVKVP